MEEERPSNEDEPDRSTNRKPSPSWKIRDQYNSTGEGSRGEKDQEIPEVKGAPRLSVHRVEQVVQRRKAGFERARDGLHKQHVSSAWLYQNEVAINQRHRFLRWNMPFAAMRSSHPRQFDPSSPFSPSARTPGSDIIVATPSSPASPHNASSSIASVVRESVAIDRARLFAQGQHHELLTRLNPDERR
jgi:hypothetical protein